MSLLKFIAILLFSLTSLSACAAEAEPKEVRQLRWVQQANPITDAKAAVARKDFVLLGVRGYTWTIPGIEDSRKLEYREKFGVRLLDGTGDVIFSAEHARLLNLAAKYAEKYNQYVLTHAYQK